MFVHKHLRQMQMRLLIKEFFSLSIEQKQIRESVLDLCSQFDDQNWLERDSTGEFPEDFCRAIADAGWIGVSVPEQYGGAGLGVTEGALILQAITESAMRGELDFQQSFRRRVALLKGLPESALQKVIDGIPMTDFVYPAWFEGFREKGSTPVT